MKILFVLGLLATIGLTSSHLVNTPPLSQIVSNTPNVDKDKNSSSEEAQQVPVFLPPQGPFSDGPIPPVDPPKKIKSQSDKPKTSDREPPVVWKPAKWQPENPAVSSGENDQHDTPVDHEPVIIDGFHSLQITDRKSKEPKKIDPVPLKPRDKKSSDLKKKLTNVVPETSGKDATVGKITPTPSENNNDWGLGVGPVIVPGDHVHKGNPIVPPIPLVRSQEHVEIGQQRREREQHPHFRKEHQFDRMNYKREPEINSHFPTMDHHKKEKEYRRFVPFKDQQEIRVQGHDHYKGEKHFQVGDSMRQHDQEPKHSQVEDSHWQHSNGQKTGKQLKHFNGPEFSTQHDHVQWEQGEKRSQQQWGQHKQQWQQQHRANWQNWQKEHRSQFN